MTIRCIAIDDEPLALSVIEEFCKRIGDMELQTFYEPQRGIAAIIDMQPDLAFLDIEMADLSGLEIARNLPKKTCFIFTTAHINYALDGFDLDAVDFLHKPFSFERFSQAVKKAARRIGYTKSDNYITVKQEYGNVPILTSDILYVEGMENYVKIYRRNGGAVISRSTLKHIIGMLPPGRFIRIHRSYIVAIEHITSFNKNQVRIGEKICLPVGRQYADELFRR